MGSYFSTLFYNFYSTNTTDVEVFVTDSDIDLNKSTKSNYKIIYTTEQHNMIYPETQLDVFNIVDLGKPIYKSYVLLYKNKVYKFKSDKINEHKLNKLLIIFRALEYFNFEYGLLPLSIYYNNSSEWIEEYIYFPQEDLFHYMFEPNGGLYKTLQDMDFEITNRNYFNIIITTFKQIITIVSALHKLNIAHLDIKPDNFLVCNDLESGNIKLKLIDFEFACINISKNHKCCGTPNYASYKLLKHKKVDNLFSCDIWSCTVILFTFLFKYFPWDTAEDTNPHMKLYLNNYNQNYWKNQLSDINMPNEYIDDFAALFDYGFNINEESIDIDKMLKILDNIKI